MFMFKQASTHLKARPEDLLGKYLLAPSMEIHCL